MGLALSQSVTRVVFIEVFTGMTEVLKGASIKAEMYVGVKFMFKIRFVLWEGEVWF